MTNKLYVIIFFLLAQHCGYCQEPSPNGSKIIWNARLYEKNPEFLQVFIDLGNYNPTYVFDSIYLTFSFQTPVNSVSKTFPYNREPEKSILVGGKKYVTYIEHRYKGPFKLLPVKLDCEIRPVGRNLSNDSKMTFLSGDSVLVGEVPDVSSINAFYGEYSLYINGLLVSGSLKYSEYGFAYVDIGSRSELSYNEPLAEQRLPTKISGNHVQLEFHGIGTSAGTIYSVDAYLAEKTGTSITGVAYLDKKKKKTASFLAVKQ